MQASICISSLFLSFTVNVRKRPLVSGNGLASWDKIKRGKEFEFFCYRKPMNWTETCFQSAHIVERLHHSLSRSLSHSYHYFLAFLCPGYCHHFSQTQRTASDCSHLDVSHSFSLTFSIFLSFLRVCTALWFILVCCVLPEKKNCH